MVLEKRNRVHLSDALRPSDCKPARSTGTQRRFSCFGDNERQPLDIEQTSSLKSAMKDAGAQRT